MSLIAFGRLANDFIVSFRAFLKTVKIERFRSHWIQNLESFENRIIDHTKDFLAKVLQSNHDTNWQQISENPEETSSNAFEGLLFDIKPFEFKKILFILFHIIFSFNRINADENDLPYHYTVDSYPTFLFFPMGR